ncbi:MAG: hypothetical protein ACKVP7_04605 [Hyphomicrobiaceae bacterium]
MRSLPSLFMRSLRFLALPTFIVAALGACSQGSMLLSEKIDEPGVIYFLPKTLATLHIAAMGRVVPNDPEAWAADADAYLTKGKGFREEIAELRIKQVDTTTVADTSRGYSLRYDPAIQSHDRVCMGVNEVGLLTSVEAAADDKTGDIIVSLAKLAGRLLGPGAFAAAPRPSADDLSIKELRVLKLEIDPLNRAHWEQVNQSLRKSFPSVGQRYAFKIDDIDKLNRETSSLDHCPEHSVCYRTRVPVRFVLGTGEGHSSTKYVQVVNKRIIGHIDVTRALMVEKITRLTFNEGVLIAANIKKPSEGLALAKLPLTVLDAITTSALAAPGAFVSQVSGQNTLQKMIEQSKSNADNVLALQKSLIAIRNGDLTPNNEDVVAATAFKLTCTPGTTPGKPPAAPGNVQ